MTREELWEEFENQLISETRTSMTMNFDEAERMTKLGIKETVAKWKKRLEQEPCEDAISRQAVLDMATTVQTDDFSGNEIMEVVDIDDVKALPSVTPTRKKGKWEYVGDNCFKCSECGEVYTVDQFNHINNYCDNGFPKGCPNCGAEMEGEE